MTKKKDITIPAPRPHLQKSYDSLYKIYKEGGEIPVAFKGGYTITMKDSWSNAFGVYFENELISYQPWFFNACAEVARHKNNLTEFPWEERFTIPTNPVYDEAVELQLAFTFLESQIREEMRKRDWRN